MTGPAACAEGRFAVPVEFCCTTSWPTHNVLFRTVPAFCAPPIGSSSDRRVATLPKGQRCRPGRHVGQLRRDRILAEIEGGEAPRLPWTLTGADEQPSDAHRHAAEQGAERRRV